MSIDLWLVPEPDMTLQQLQAMSAGLLSEDEQKRFDSQRLPKGQFTFLHTRVALRKLLSHYWPAVEPGAWRFRRSHHGKPFVFAPPGVVPTAGSYNLTHADGMLAIAVCDSGEVGVDIEPHTREVDALALAKRFFTDEEFQLLNTSAADIRQSLFLEIWTLKEACVKACGMGLAHALRHFSFEPLAAEGLAMTLHRPIQPAPESGADHWQVWSGIHGAFRLGLACQMSAADSSPQSLTVQGFDIVSGVHTAHWQQQRSARS
ncbi:MAG TPA: hypothetical protein DEG76_11135 [Pseudohongiella sp.]|nr:hypothetical protein [Pseudohongiella sp.]